VVFPDMVIWLYGYYGYIVELYFLSITRPIMVILWNYIF